MDQLIRPERQPSASATIVYGILALCAIHQLLIYFDYASLSPLEIIWNTLVYLTPTRLLLSADQRQELHGKGMLSQRNAAKSEALRKMLGLGGNNLISNLSGGNVVSGAGGIMRRASMLAGAQRPAISEAPSGLGNWDNSCYQNSVLQALASVKSLPAWLDVCRIPEQDDQATTSSALQETIAKLRDPANNGRHIWTPAKLKNMSSWQQQDAQEYFSKVLDELDKEATKKGKSELKKRGLEIAAQEQTEESKLSTRETSSYQNPLEGLIAQRVACTECGFSEGYSMIPFNCLTVPLGSAFTYNLSDCLDEYTKREEIEGVECRKCTLLKSKQRLNQLANTEEPQTMAASGALPNGVLSLPPEVREQVLQRLDAIENALELDDFSDKTLKGACQIQPKAFATSTKVREALVGRAPQTLVVHINRSVFDEMTGAQRKNYAQVHYPLILNLNPWLLDLGGSAPPYRLKAAVTHYGRHENGHYICYRQHPSNIDEKVHKVPEKWWRLSDEDVTTVTETDVLNQSGAFMLFYEREEYPESWTQVADAATVALPADDPADFAEVVEDESVATDTERPALTVPASPSVVTESDTDIEEEQAKWTAQPLPQAPLLRTASPQVLKHEFETTRPLMRV